MKRPRIKTEHRPVRYGQDYIRIGGAVPGIAADIHDPDGSVWALLGLLDGTRTVDQVIAAVVHRFPHLHPDDVRTDIDDLNGRGHIEDAEPAAPRQLDDLARERYSRGQRWWTWVDRVPRATGWHAQLALTQSRILVIGLGGAGGAAALALAQSGVGALHCVDFDAVELSNLNRQSLYTEHDLGRSKVRAALARLRAFNSTVAITGEHRPIGSTAAVRAIAPNFDVVLLAADQPQEITSWVNQGCAATGTAWVHCGYHGPIVSVGMYRPGHGPCYDCVVAETAAQRRRAGFPATRHATNERYRPTQAATAVTAGMTGLLAAHAVMSLITGIPPTPAPATIVFNLLTRTASTLVPVMARPGCGICGTGSP